MMKMIASVCAVAFLLVAANAADAGCYRLRVCGPRILLRPICVPVKPVCCKPAPVPMQAVPVEYPTPVRNLIFGTHRLVPTCVDGSCGKKK